MSKTKQNQTNKPLPIAPRFQRFGGSAVPRFLRPLPACCQTPTAAGVSRGGVWGGGRLGGWGFLPALPRSQDVGHIHVVRDEPSARATRPLHGWFFFVCVVVFFKFKKIFFWVRDRGRQPLPCTPPPALWVPPAGL